MPIDSRVLALLNRQINAEQYASSLYLAVAAWADAEGYDGLAGWCLGESEEEARHARHFFDYTRDRGRARVAQIGAPPAAWRDYGEALATLLEAEQAVSAALTELHAAATSAGDPATCLIASRQILDAQVPAERRLETAIRRVARATDLECLDFELWEEDAA